MSSRELLHSFCYFLGLSSFHSVFSLIREVLNGFWDLCLSLNFVLDSGNAMSPVASDADCPSADRSHVHGHVGELLVNIVHTLVVDHAILFNDVR